MQNYKCFTLWLCISNTIRFLTPSWVSWIIKFKRFYLLKTWYELIWSICNLFIGRIYDYDGYYVKFSLPTNTMNLMKYISLHCNVWCYTFWLRAPMARLVHSFYTQKHYIPYFSAWQTILWINLVTGARGIFWLYKYKRICTFYVCSVSLL